MARLSHVDSAGKARMVDVSRKAPTRREATARGSVTLSQEAFDLIRRNRAAKGDVLAVARIAGIQAAKRTWELIPLCHPLPLDGIDVRLDLDSTKCAVLIETTARTRAATGVEMEALMAAAVAGLTVYDMVKAVDRTAVVGEIRLIEKRGGRSGRFRRPGGRRVEPAARASRTGKPPG
jgi:cyclic pyranopterin phosphate synthase